jgi:formamidopyrimidine-DNA glycosylase
MPELPEVQTVINDMIAAGVQGATITDARVFWPRTIDTHHSRDFCRKIRRRRIKAITRRGKYIVFHLAPQDCLVVHLRMTGRFHLQPAGTRRSKHDHVVFRLDDKRQLLFFDTRKFGRFSLVPDPDIIVGCLGPEPLGSGFTAGSLTGMLASRSRQIKPLLLDQRFLAGLGNIYVDEALWEARIHPLRNSAGLTPAESKRLHRAIRKVLRKGLKNFGTTLGKGVSNFYSIGRKSGKNREQLNVFRRTGEDCPRCGNAVKCMVVGQRSTHICSVCQKIKT